MRQLQRSQRGSANWPFILSLLLLLAFVYLWFSQRDDLEAAQRATKEAQAKEAEALQVAQEFVSYGRELSALVGWDSKLAGDVIANPELKTAANAIPGTNEFYFTDLEKLRVNLRPDGAKEDGSPGLLNYLINQAEIEIQQEVRRASGEGVKEVAANFEWMSPELREAVAAINALEIPKPPVPPFDPDDEAEEARFQSEMTAYEGARQRWEDTVDAASRLEGWNKMESIIRTVGKFDPETMQVVLLDMFPEDLTGKVTIADLMTYPPKIVDNFKREFTANKTEDQAVIQRLQADAAAKATEIGDLQTQLSDEQNRHTSDVDQLRGEVAQANETAEQNRREATTALNNLAREKDEKEVSVTGLEAEIRARDERIRLDKQKRDLEIRRDDPDGRVLSSNPRMETAVIDLGSSDKVYPGLRFAVSRIGRGGIRYVLGQVTVTSVLGPRSSKVAVTAVGDAANPVLRGDIVSNPFFNSKGPIYLYIAGELEKYPREVALARLTKMNVIVDDKPSGRTDYIVVPDAMAEPVVAAAEDEEIDDEGGAAGAQTAFGRLESVARTVGATVITERMLNRFLGL